MQARGLLQVRNEAEQRLMPERAAGGAGLLARAGWGAEFDAVFERLDLGRCRPAQLETGLVADRARRRRRQPVQSRRGDGEPVDGATSER